MGLGALRADKYHGATARNYDAEREGTERWAAEYAAVERMVTQGPVLDVPLGTGRYVPVYRGKGLEFTGVDISSDMLAEAERKHGIAGIKASIFSLPFEPASFATAVCTRMLDWLTPGQMADAMAELRRVAGTIIVSIRHGRERIEVNQTHSLAKFYEAIAGLHIESRVVTESWRGDIEEIFKLRPPSWDDVLAQFEWHTRGTPQQELQRLADEWIGVLLDERVELKPDRAAVSAEYWKHDELGDVLLAMAAVHDHKQVRAVAKYITDLTPRCEEGPATILRSRGAKIILDGRCRINRRMKVAGRYPVLAIDA